MTRQELLATLEEGLENGRISRHTAAYIAAELLGIAADETAYHDWDELPLLIEPDENELLQQAVGQPELVLA